MEYSAYTNTTNPNLNVFFLQNAMANYMFISGQGPQKDNFSSDHGLQFSFWCLGPEMNM